MTSQLIPDERLQLISGTLDDVSVTSHLDRIRDNRQCQRSCPRQTSPQIVRSCSEKKEKIKFWLLFLFWDPPDLLPLLFDIIQFLIRYVTFSLNFEKLSHLGYLSIHHVTFGDTASSSSRESRFRILMNKILKWILLAWDIYVDNW